MEILLYRASRINTRIPKITPRIIATRKERLHNPLRIVNHTLHQTKNTYLNALTDCSKVIEGQNWHPIRQGKTGNTQIKVSLSYLGPHRQGLSV